MDSRDGSDGRSSMENVGRRVGVGAWTLAWWMSAPMSCWWVIVEAVMTVVLGEKRRRRVSLFDCRVTVIELLKRKSSEIWRECLKFVVSKECAFAKE